MKAFLEQVDIERSSSIKARTYAHTRLDVPLHYHPEHEIVLIVKGSGTVLVADASVRFAAGDLFFFGSNLPHLFVDEEPNSQGRAEVVVIQFREDLFSHFNSLPEFTDTMLFLSQMKQGLRLRGFDHRALVLDISRSEGVEKFNRLCFLLDFIVKKGNYQTITSGPSSAINSLSSQRLQAVHLFLQQHYSEPVSIEEAAAGVNLGKASFCRFLKKETGKTFTEMLNIVRIEKACALLRDTPLTATQIGYETGFNHPAYFHRQFKHFQGLSPSAYRQRFVRKMRGES